MHILGILVGRREGNSAILLKAALQAASKARPGITTSLVHLPSASIPPNYKPLDGALDITIGGVGSVGEDIGAQYPDDRAKILAAILNSDAIIIGTPVYSRCPPGVLKAVTDSILGPLSDVAFAKIALEGQKQGDKRFANARVDERLLKPRVGGFLIVSGSPKHEPEQWCGVYPTMHQLLTPLHVQIVDQALFNGYANAGAVLIREEETIARARVLGQRIASQMGKSFDGADYLGPNLDGSCPYCHLLKIELLNDNRIMCTVCGSRGELKVGDGRRILPVWGHDTQYSHITMAGKMAHAIELMNNPGQEKAKIDQLKEKLEYWRTLSIERVLLSGEAGKFSKL